MTVSQEQPSAERDPAVGATTIATDLAASPNWFFEALTARGLTGVVFQIYQFTGEPTHVCPLCINAFATTCRAAHIWFYTKFDPMFRDMMDEADGTRSV